MAGGEVSEPFDVIAGVKQGCVLAPVLFNLFVSAVSSVAHRDLDRNTDGVCISYRYDGGGLFNLGRLRAKTMCRKVLVDELQYADDAAFVSHTEQGLQRVVNSVNDAYHRSGLRINTEKTEIMIQKTGTNVSSNDRTSSISIGDRVLSNVETFTYLGSVLSSDYALTNEVYRRIGLASAAFGKLSRRVFKNHNLNLHTKRAVYQAVCLSILLFGCEAWALYRPQFRKLEAFHGTCVQDILGVKWYDRVPRAESRERLGVSSLEEIILKRQLRWFGHVVRMSEDRLPRKVLYGELSTGKRSAGGQKKRYKDNIKRTLKHFHLDPNRAESNASERCGWARQVAAGAAAFAADFAAAEAERRARRHNPGGAGDFVCDACGRRCASLAGLRSHGRVHEREERADPGAGGGVVIDIDGLP